MPDIIFKESEIISKQEVTTAYNTTGLAYVGRSTAGMIRKGTKAILILIEE